MKKILFMLSTVVLLLTACGDIQIESIGGGNSNTNNSNGNNGSDTQTTASIKVNSTSITLDLEKNTTFKLEASTIAADGSDLGGVTYSSANDKVASVLNDGTVTAVAKGYTFINITSIQDKNITSSVEVIVNEKAGESGAKYKITANPASLSIDKDSNELLSQINLTFTPQLEAGSFIYYESKDTTVAKIVGSGNSKAIQGVALGNTFLRIGVSGQTGSYVDIPVLVKEAGLPEPVMYPDINPSDVDTHRDRMYLKIKFDAYSSSDDLYNDSSYVGINAVVFQNDNYCASGICSGDLINKGNGHLNPYGYCEKYGCSSSNSGYDNAQIAKKNVGITYYAGNNNLYVPVSTAGTSQNYTMYIVLETLPGNHYTRDNIVFPINWANYNPAIYKNIAKFTITYRDRKPTAVFDGFESK